MSGYQMNFNQDFTSISVLNTNGFQLYSITSNDKVEEIFTKENLQVRIVERLFNSPLVVLVTVKKPNCLRLLHFKKKQDIGNCVYPTEILCVRMNRQRLVVCLAESIHIHDIRDMKILHSIMNIAPNELGLCALSLNSDLAFPICSFQGELRIFNGNKLRPGLTVQAHETPLSALNFSPNGLLLATASERGTVIRMFCVKSGQRLQEFRRGVIGCVRIASLVFSSTGDFLCASSNTETVHIFKVNVGVVKVRKANAVQDGEEGASPKQAAATKVSKVESFAVKLDTDKDATNSSSSWSGYLTKGVSSYLIPSQVSDMLSQDRAFATATLPQPGIQHVIGMALVQKQLQLLIACEDGFLYIHDFSAEHGGPCKLLRMHDLRCVLEDMVELNLTESLEKATLSPTSTQTTAETSSVKSANKTAIETVATSATTKEATLKTGNAGMSSMLLENPDPAPDNSYAGILKGEQAANNLTESAKYRKLLDAIDSPTELFDKQEFPPVAKAAKD